MSLFKVELQFQRLNTNKCGLSMLMGRPLQITDVVKSLFTSIADNFPHNSCLKTLCDL
jgi:hypothetical protein